MKYSITIEWETKIEVGDAIYVFKGRESEGETKLSDLENYCNYEEKTVTAIKPMLYKQPNWDWAIRFEFMCWTDAYNSDNIFSFFKEWSYQNFYYSKEHAELEKAQRIKSVTSKLDFLK